MNHIRIHKIIIIGFLTTNITYNSLHVCLTQLYPRGFLYGKHTSVNKFDLLIH